MAHRRWIAWLAAPLLALSGCAGTPRGGHPSGGLFAGAAFDALVRAAEQENPHPTAAEVPQGIDPDLVRDLEDPTEALTPLDVVLAALPEAVAPPPEPGDETADRRDAMRLYVAGREAMLDGDDELAVERLGHAAELAPESAAIRARLADAQLAAGSRAEAMQSITRALELGERDPVQILELASHETLRGRHERAASLYALALRLDLERTDPALPVLIRIGLGEALHRLGRLAAGNELLAEALDLPSPEYFRGTHLRREMTGVYRRRGELWRTVGDAECRMGRYGRAIDAYDRASESAALDRGEGLGRRLYARLRLGLRYGAALCLVEEFEQAGGLVDGRARRLLNAVATDPEIRRLLAGVLGDGAERVAGRSASIAGSLDRARAELLGADEARRILRERVLHRPFGRATVDALFATYDPADAAGLAHEAAGLAAQRPFETDLFAIALLDAAASFHDIDAALAGGSEDARLVRAFVLSEVGRARDAADVAHELTGPGAVAAEARVGWSAGKPERAQQAVDALIALDDTDAWRAAGRALASAQRLEQARTVLLDLGETHPEAYDTDLAVQLAELSANLGLLDEARRHAVRATEIDPYDERAYKGLLLLQQAAPSAESALAQTEIVRRLREHLPSSRALREVSAREALQRGQIDRAERELMNLSDEAPSDASPVNLLTQIWEQVARAGDYERLGAAEAWLRERLATHPESPVLTGALARVLVADARAEEGEELLRATIARRPSPLLDRMLESVLRDALGRVEEADEMAVARLDASPETPGALLELAGVLVRAGKMDEAAEKVRRFGELAGSPDARQSVALAGLAAQAVAAAQAGEAAPHPHDTLQLIGAVVDLGVVLPLELHRQRLRLLAADESSTPEQILAGVVAVGEQYPTRREDAFREAALHLIDAGRGREAVLVFAGGGDLLDDETFRRTLLFALVTPYAMRPEFEAVADALEARGLVAETVSEGEPARIAGMSKSQVHAELLYHMGMWAHQAGRPEAAEDAYAATLAVYPEHAWANNNLGYAWAERGERLDEAERMLESAYDQLPDEPSIIDSLAWVRYKLGMIRDEPDGRKGALSLLEQAAQTPEGIRNSTILDHLGDAQWRVGQEEQASESWRRAQAMGQQALARSGITGADAEQLQDELVSVQRKLREVEAGAEPSISPTAAETSGKGDG